MNTKIKTAVSGKLTINMQSIACILVAGQLTIIKTQNKI